MTRWLLGALLLTACSVGSGRDPESTGAECQNGIDDDADELADCADPDCREQAWCAAILDDAGFPTDRDLPPPVPCVEPIDLVFVVDVSTSMEDEIEAIRLGIDRIAAAAMALTPDVQLSLVVFVDDVVAVNGCLPFDSISTMQSELQRWQAFTSSNDQPAGGADSNTDCPENSLDALYDAAMMCPWRTNSTRIIIHVTDDTFVENPDTLSGSGGFGGGGIQVERTYAETVNVLVDRQIQVGAFAAPGAGEECGAGTSPDVGQGFFTDYDGMPSIPEATHGRAWSIREVRAGTLDMADAITEFTESIYCLPF